MGTRNAYTVVTEPLTKMSDGRHYNGMCRNGPHDLNWPEMAQSKHTLYTAELLLQY